MVSEKQTTGLLLIDFINEIVDPKGKLSGKGYSDFVARHGTLSKAHSLLSSARSEGIPIFHVRICFSPNYVEQPELSPLFGSARKFGAFQAGTWATEFHPKVAPEAHEVVLEKHRVSAFYGTSLDLVLRNQGIQNLLICGVATDLAVQSAVRDAHDRDYIVTVVSDCCGAANEEDHEQSLRILAKIAKTTTFGEVSFVSTS